MLLQRKTKGQYVIKMTALYNQFKCWPSMISLVTFTQKGGLYLNCEREYSGGKTKLTATYIKPVT